MYAKTKVDHEDTRPDRGHREEMIATRATAHDSALPLEDLVQLALPLHDATVHQALQDRLLETDQVNHLRVRLLVQKV